MLASLFQNLFRIREKASSRLSPGADDGFDAFEKPFLDHLDDLRVTLFKIIGTLTISTVACFAFHRQIYELVQYPAKSKMAEIAPGVPLWDKLDLITLGPTEFIMLMLKLSFYSGIIITFPFTVYFLFQFIIPGLRQAEKKAIIPGVALGFVLFLVGGTFAFFVTIPLSLKYFYQFENQRSSNLDPVVEATRKPIHELGLFGLEGEHIPPVDLKAKKAETPAPENEGGLDPATREAVLDYLKHTLTTAEGSNFAFRYDATRDKLVLVAAKGGHSSYQAGKFISFVSQLVLVFGISFQMPIVVTILVKLELLTARVMRSTRSYAWVLIMVLAAILTPSPDALTMCMLGVPLIVLYEICILVATVIEKKREREERAEEKARQSRMEQLYLKPAAELTEEEKAEMHRAEIEQYEREHAHLYDQESEHVSRDTLHGDPHHDDPHHGHEDHLHDESWHADDHYWHEDPHHGMESDHAEPEDLSPEPAEEVKPAAKEWSEFENCAPEGPVVDLNYASLEELQTLPGIGPKMAQVLLDHRPYETFDDLDRVPGLGPEKIRRITERIMLG